MSEGTKGLGIRYNVCMITLLTGDNSFEIERYIQNEIKNFNGDVERIDSDSINLNNLPDLLMGISLFSQKRLIIIRQLSQNASIWKIIGDWLDKISDDIKLIIIEPTLDKRTSAYKAINKIGDIKEFISWTDKDYLKAEHWAISEAKKQGFEISKESARLLVRKIGVDQWQLFHALEKLSVLDDINSQIIEDVIETNSFENALNLLESAIQGDLSSVRRVIFSIKNRDDPHRLFALLSSQAFNILAIYASENPKNISDDLGVHPYVVTKLGPIAKKLGSKGISRLIDILVKTDDNLKISKVEPWILIENALIKITAI